MPESFLELPQDEQSRIYRTLAERLGRRAIVLEKDVWVCWTLKTLFEMPGRPTMAFKGGTSLSKVYRAIDRFSEDIDVTLDYRARGDTFDPFAPGVSSSQLKKYGQELKEYVCGHVGAVVVPHFTETLARQFVGAGGRIEVEGDGDTIRIHYPPAAEADEGYLVNSVLLEFGGRNITEPNETHEVRPDIAPELPELTFPHATVTVLSPKRTFWEKATLMHVACNRPAGWNGDRYSRHWYDLVRLSALPFGEEALADRGLLADVVKHKKVFFNNSYADYDSCLEGRLQLVPREPVLTALRKDYRAMIDSGMFAGVPPRFEELLAALGDLEGRINRG